MSEIHGWIRNRLLERAGLVERPKPKYDLKELERTEWSSAFEQLMRNRLIMGALRYGRMNSDGKPQYDRIRSAITRLYGYLKTGNLELLVDVANLCVLEFEEGRHPNRHWATLDAKEAEEYHCEITWR